MADKISFASELTLFLGEDDIEESLAKFSSVVFENLRFGGFEGHIGEVDSEGGFDGVVMEEGDVFGDGFECFLLLIIMSVFIIFVIVVMGPILPIVVVIVIIAMEIFFQNKPLKIFILITGGFFRFPISIVVVVVLIIPASKFVKEIYIFRSFDSEPFAIC